MTQESITRIGETKANWHLTSTFLRSLQLFQKLKVPRHWKAVMNMLKISNQYNTIRLPTLEYSNHQDMYAADVTFLLLLLLLLTDHYFSRWRALHIAVLTMSGVRGSRRTQAYNSFEVWFLFCFVTNFAAPTWIRDQSFVPTKYVQTYGWPDTYFEVYVLV